MRKLLPAILAVFLAATALRAQEDPEGPEHPIDIALEECLSIDSNQSTYGMMDCLHKAQEGWDAEMNRSYKELIGLLDSAGQNALRTAQRAWLKYRDAEVELCGRIYYENMEGTMYHVIAADRVTELTRLRAKELQSYIDTMTEMGE